MSEISKPNKLPEAWVQRIFATMQGHYGTRFLNMWKTGQVLSDGNDAGMVNAMHHWGERLAWYVNSPETIKEVLERLPVEPPSLPQFAEMLRTAYKPPAVPKLERKWTQVELDANKQRVKEMLEKLNMKGKI